MCKVRKDVRMARESAETANPVRGGHNQTLDFGQVSGIGDREQHSTRDSMSYTCNKHSDHCVITLM